MNQRIKIVDLETGRVSSLKKFKEKSLIEFNKTHLSFCEIVERRLLSKGELKKLVTAGTLMGCKYKKNI